MYGDTGLMRKRVAQLREQAADLRAATEQLVARTDAVKWTGRAGDVMRRRILDRADHLREVADRHEVAAASLERHLEEVERLKERITATERRADTLVGDARARVARAESFADLPGIRSDETPEDRLLSQFVAPPPGHKDWLTVDLPGLR